MAYWGIHPPTATVRGQCSIIHAEYGLYAVADPPTQHHTTALLIIRNAPLWEGFKQAEGFAEVLTGGSLVVTATFES